MTKSSSDDASVLDAFLKLESFDPRTNSASSSVSASSTNASPHTSASNVDGSPRSSSTGGSKMCPSEDNNNKMLSSSVSVSAVGVVEDKAEIIVRRKKRPNPADVKDSATQTLPRYVLFNHQNNNNENNNSNNNNNNNIAQITSAFPKYTKELRGPSQRRKRREITPTWRIGLKKTQTDTTENDNFRSNDVVLEPGLEMEQMRENEMKQLRDNAMEQMRENEMEQMRKNKIDQMKENEIEQLQKNAMAQLLENAVDQTRENEIEQMCEDRMEQMCGDGMKQMGENAMEQMRENKTEQTRENETEQLQENETEQTRENAMEQTRENATEQMRQTATEQMHGSASSTIKRSTEVKAKTRRRGNSLEVPPVSSEYKVLNFLLWFRF